MKLFKSLLLATLAAVSMAAFAQEATIRKNLAERLPNLPAIDEVSKTPMPGVFEIRVNQSEIFYTDAEGNYLIQGSMIDTKARTNLTEQRVEKLTALAFKSLPLKDAFTLVRGNGKRKMAVFEDPNCGYCKRLHREFAKIDNVTVHVFLIPVLGDDSVDKARRIWCAKDKAKTYSDWMVNNQAPASATCDTAAIERNSRLATKHGIRGTPTMIFVNDIRVPGYIAADQIEKQLAEAKP
ncbi:DsbC family protein [Hydrogenophaga sp.]|uniref:DsbC family protein n=1 Tax=Hydrogenophaga sp. TaxID=1904254 RepID=UPI00271C41EB|nr:DsbC family protein [Hydrogenophaga sp.]MDO9438460.1 DsbC family protein [Hydrogenophaga sp.]